MLRDSLINFYEKNNGEEVLELQEGDGKYHFYMVSIGDNEAVDVGKDNWDEITAPFFEMVENHEIPGLTLEEVFGEWLEKE